MSRRRGRENAAMEDYFLYLHGSDVDYTEPSLGSTGVQDAG